MYNGFDLPGHILDEHLKFIREEKNRINSRLDMLNNLKGYEKKSDDAETLLRGYQTLIKELGSLLRHEYDAEK